MGVFMGVFMGRLAGKGLGVLEDVGGGFFVVFYAADQTVEVVSLPKASAAAQEPVYLFGRKAFDGMHDGGEGFFFIRQKDEMDVVGHYNIVVKIIFLAVEIS